MEQAVRFVLATAELSWSSKSVRNPCQRPLLLPWMETTILPARHGNVAYNGSRQSTLVPESTRQTAMHGNPCRGRQTHEPSHRRKQRVTALFANASEALREALQSRRCVAAALPCNAWRPRGLCAYQSR